MENFLNEFKSYCSIRNWSFDQFTSEFTFQFRICRFLESQSKLKLIELESNINRYGLYNLTKKEIDIDITDEQKNRIAIELKYVRDKGSYNIGMYKFCEDLKFLEELTRSKAFDTGYGIIFTSIPELYSKPKRELNPKNKENLKLYEGFRLKKRLSGDLAIKTGSLNENLNLSGSYSIHWQDFALNIKACLIKVVRT